MTIRLLDDCSQCSVAALGVLFQIKGKSKSCVRVMRNLRPRSVQCCRRMSSASTHQSLDEVTAMLQQDRQWYTTAEAKHILTEFTSGFASTSIPTANMVDLISSRCPNISKDQFSRMNTALRAISALLTTPLTLAHSLNILSNVNDGRRSVALLGARAEASLPLIWWKEASQFFRLNSATIPPPLDVYCIGPDLPSNVEPVRCFDNDIKHQTGSRLLAYPSFKAPYDSSIASQLPPLCATVLMNPGIGSPSLAPLWQPSLRLLLSSDTPIIFTSHCSGDLERDLLALQETAKNVDKKISFILEPTANPYASLTPTIDGSREAAQATNSSRHDLRLIYSNAFIYIVRAQNM